MANRGSKGRGAKRGMPGKRDKVAITVNFTQDQYRRYLASKAPLSLRALEGVGPMIIADLMSMVKFVEEMKSIKKYTENISYPNAIDMGVQSAVEAAEAIIIHYAPDRLRKV